MTKINQIVESVPKEIRTTLKVLSDDTRLGIALILLKEGEKSFSDLGEILEIPRNVLSHHLKVLSQTALVRNYYAKRENTTDYSYYSTTLLLRDCMDRLFGLAEPRKSSADVLAGLLVAGRGYGEGLAKLLSALNEYGEMTSLDSITLVKGEEIKLPLSRLRARPIRKNME